MSNTLDQLRALPHQSYTPDPVPAKWMACIFGKGWVDIHVADLDLDDDGAPSAAIKNPDKDYQAQTSEDPGGKVISAFTTPYMVLPPQIATHFGIELGTLCAVIDETNGELIVGATYSDIGPHRKIGEGSVALQILLGADVVRHGRLIDQSLGHDVRYLLFPGQTLPKTATSDEIQSAVRGALAQLLGS